MLQRTPQRKELVRRVCRAASRKVLQVCLGANQPDLVFACTGREKEAGEKKREYCLRKSDVEEASRGRGNGNGDTVKENQYKELNGRDQQTPPQ